MKLHQTMKSFKVRKNTNYFWTGLWYSRPDSPKHGKLSLQTRLCDKPKQSSLPAFIKECCDSSNLPNWSSIFFVWYVFYLKKDMLFKVKVKWKQLLVPFPKLGKEILQLHIEGLPKQKGGEGKCFGEIYKKVASLNHQHCLALHTAYT